MILKPMEFWLRTGPNSAPAKYFLFPPSELTIAKGLHEAEYRAAMNKVVAQEKERINADFSCPTSRVGHGGYGTYVERWCS